MSKGFMCVRRPLYGGPRCQNKALAYCIKEREMVVGMNVPTLCGPHCLEVLETARPDERIIYQRLDTEEN